MSLFPAFCDELSSTGLGPKIHRVEATPEEINNLLEVGRAGTDSGVAGFSGSDARRVFKSLLTSGGGKQIIRGVFNKLDTEAEKVRSLKDAFVRGLLRARRDIQGPSSHQRKDLMSMIFQSDGSPDSYFSSKTNGQEGRAGE